jgi:UDP-N-acetylglucosamine 2-epimerase (non-hydrolysing)
MRVVSIVGARPQFVKVAPICWNTSVDFHHEIVHTGQHYDEMLSESIFRDLRIPAPAINLGVGSGSHAEQTSTMMIRLEKYFLKDRPDHVILYGDTNSTLAGGLVTSKLLIPTSHVEAGLRSGNREMPEETNRIVTDHLSDILFAPTRISVGNLAQEGLREKTVLSGDIMVETINFARSMIDTSNLNDEYVYCTIHRAENTDNEQRLKEIFTRLCKSPITVHLFAHPRLIKKIAEYKIKFDNSLIELRDALPYIKNIETLAGARGVITDSGGLQKEAFMLGVPCLTIRTETEWTETNAGNWNQIDPNGMRISEDWWNDTRGPVTINPFGDGAASKLIVSKILDFRKKDR